MKNQKHIRLIQALGFSGIGQRARNEDAFWPEVADATESCLVLCDGLGGAAAGHLASQIAARTIYDFLKSQTDTGLDPGRLIRGAVAAAVNALGDYEANNPPINGMATTMTLCWVWQERLILAHVGDSRIYVFRKGNVAYKSYDHSYVNELLAKGEISAEDANRHPMKNRVTRVIKSDRVDEAEVFMPDEIRDQDLVLLCSDGLLESWSDLALIQLISSTSQLEEMVRILSERCRDNSSDNYTGYLIRIGVVNAVQDENIPPTVRDQAETDPVFNGDDRSSEEAEDEAGGLSAGGIAKALRHFLKF